MKRLLALLVIVLLAAQGGTAIAASNESAPPPSSIFGKPLDEWMQLHISWFLRGSGPDNHVGKVQFLPLPAGTYVGGAGTPDDPAIFNGHEDVTLGVGQGFALPVAVWIGETYDPSLGYPDDTMLDKTIFTEANDVVTLDGRRVIDSNKQPLSKYYFETTFPETIMYGGIAPNGAIGALWAQGIGIVHEPLSVGTHTLELHSELTIPDFDLGVVYNNTWTITVER